MSVSFTRLAGTLLVLAACSEDQHEREAVDGEATNVVISADVAYAAIGSRGVLVRDLTTDADVATIAPVMGAIHDVAIDASLLFALDAQTGVLTVFDVSSPTAAVVVGGPATVPQTRFGGVAAASGNVVVSGGTSELSAYRYAADGTLSAPMLVDLGTGQPDVELADDGLLAFVSTHFAEDEDGDEFGISCVSTSDLAIHDRIGIDDAGFTPGTTSPANFAIETATSGDTLAVAHGGGVALLDVANPDAITCRTIVELDFRAVNVDAEDGMAYVVGSDPEPTLAVVDIAAASVVSTTSLSGLPSGVAVGSAKLGVAAGPAGLLVVDR